LTDILGLTGTADVGAVPSSGSSNGQSVVSKSLSGAAEREAMNWAEEKFELCRKSRIQFERAWYTNIAFYFGRQYVQWTPNFGTGSNYARMYEPPAPPWRVRLVTNKIRPIIRSEHAKLTKEDPQPYVIPASTDDDDLAGARAAENIFEYLWRDLKAKRVIRRMTFWQCLTGNGFIKDWYDGQQPDSSGIPGRIRLENITPFHFFVPDVEEEEIEFQPYVFHVAAKTPEYIKDTWGVEVPADSNSSGGVLEQKFLQALGIQQQTGYDHVSVKECWVKPCGKWPNGAVIIYAADTPLSVTDSFPWDHGEYPFTKFDHVPTGRFYAESVISDLIPLQKEYNRTRSQIIEAKNRMAKPQLVAPRGSIDPNKITSEPGLIVFYTPGFAPPTPLKLEPIPEYVIEELNRCQTDMADISGQHEVTKGQAPPGVTAATAISYLQEADDTKLANTVSSLEEGIERIGKHLLEMVQQFWDLPRTVRVVGTDGEYESFIFSNQDLAGNTDLNVQSGSAMPRSRAAKQAFIMQLGQMGWIPPDRALRYLDMAETGRLYEEMQRDARAAQRENLKMLKGMPVNVHSWDEHTIHINEHNDERKRQRFDSSDPQVQAAFEEHVQMHQQALQQNQMQAAAMAQVSGGAPGQPPLPGAPPGLPGHPGAPNLMPPPHQLPPGGAAHPVNRQVQMPPINPLAQQGPSG
jgi:hypothetical protein